MRKIVVATDGLTGGSSIEEERISSNEDKGGDENGMDEEEDEDAEEVEEGVNPLIVPPIIPGNLIHSFDSTGDNNDDGGINSSFPLNDDEDCRGLFDAAAIPSSRACGGSEKRKAGDGVNLKRSRAFSQTLKMPRKSSPGNSKDGNDNNPLKNKKKF